MRSAFPVPRSPFRVPRSPFWFGVGEVKRMSVLPDVRGCGIGRRLLAALESRALELDHRTVRLETGKGQPEERGRDESWGQRKSGHAQRRMPARSESS